VCLAPLSSGGRFGGSARVGDHGASLGVPISLGYGDAVQRCVELPVAGAGQTVAPGWMTKPAVGRTGVAGVGVPGAESVDAGGLTEDPRRGQRPHPQIASSDGARCLTSSVISASSSSISAVKARPCRTRARASLATVPPSPRSRASTVSSAPARGRWWCGGQVTPVGHVARQVVGQPADGEVGVSVGDQHGDLLTSSLLEGVGWLLWNRGADDRTIKPSARPSTRPGTRPSTGTAPRRATPPLGQALRHPHIDGPVRSP
jgi:hypothetical protein